MLSIRYVLTSDEHGDNAEYFLAGGIGAHVSKANTCQTRAGEVESRNVSVRVRHVVHRHPEAIRERVNPPWKRESFLPLGMLMRRN